MKKAIALISLYSLLISNLAWSVGKIQNEDVKSLSDLTSAGGTASQLINTTKIYDVTNAQQLSTSIANGTLGGASGGSGGIELLNNPGFEFGAITNGWSTSGGTAALVASGATGFLFGNETASWTASASGQTFSSTAYALNGLASGNCAASLYYTYGGSSGDYTFEALDGSSNVLASKSLSAQSSVALPTTITWACNSSKTATIQWVLKSNVASPSIIYFDNAHLGSNTNLGTVQQAIYLGTVSYLGGSGCAWVTTSAFPTYANFAAVSGCPTATTTGIVQPPATKIPGFILNSVPAGDYYMVANSVFQASVGGAAAQWRFSDGTNFSNGGGYNSQVAAAYIPNLVGHIYEPTTLGQTTFQIQGNVTSGNNQIYAAQTGYTFTIDVYYFPPSAQQVFNGNTSPANWSGTSTLSGTTTSGSVTDPGSVTGTVTTTSSSNITCTAASSLVGITCSLPSAGSYSICYSGYVSNTSSGAVTQSQLTDGSNVVVVGSQYWNSPSANSSGSVGGCSNYSAASTTVTFKQRGAVGAGTGTYTPTSFSIFSLITPVAAPIVQNSISTNASGSWRQEVAEVDANCSSSPCTISQQSGSWLTSITRSGTGSYSANFTTGGFTTFPICTCISGQGMCTSSSAATTSSWSFFVFNTAGESTDGNFKISCMGSH